MASYLLYDDVSGLGLNDDPSLNLLMGSSDSFTILGSWVLGLAVTHNNESNCKLMNPEHYL